MERLLEASSAQAQAQSTSFLTRLRAGCLTHRAYEHLLYERKSIRNALDLDLFLSHVQQNDLQLYGRAGDERVRRLVPADRRRITAYLDSAVGTTDYALGVKDHLETLKAKEEAEEREKQERQGRERAEARVGELEARLRAAEGAGAAASGPKFFASK
jgi:hypothetical protein